MGGLASTNITINAVRARSCLGRLARSASLHRFSGLSHQNVAQFARSRLFRYYFQMWQPMRRQQAMIAQEVDSAEPKARDSVRSFGTTGQKWTEKQCLSKFLRDTLRHLREGGVDDIVLLGPSPAWQPSLPMAVYQYWLEKAELPMDCRMRGTLPVG